MGKRNAMIILAAVAAIFVLAPVAMAAEAGAADAGISSTVKLGLALASGFGLAIAAFGGALSQGRAVTAAMEGISRNPGARAQMFIPLVLGLVFIESLVLYMLVLAIMLQGKIG